MKYKKYILGFIIVSSTFTLVLYYFGDKDLFGSLFIGIGATAVTLINKIYLNKKNQKKKI